MNIVIKISIASLIVFLNACTESNRTERNKEEQPNIDQIVETEKKHYAGAIPTRYPVLAEGHEPEAKFTVQNTQINTFQAANSYNGSGFAYVYQRRSGEGAAHYYKLIQEFQDIGFNSAFPDRQILAEHWIEITENEWIETYDNYQKTGKLKDLYPQAFQDSLLYQKRLAFLNR